jgi:hypothetical protein
LLMLLLLTSCSRQMPVVTLSSAAPLAPPLETEPLRSLDSSPQEAVTQSEGFRFPQDRGGKLLADLLPPAQQQSRLPSDEPATPVRFALPRSLERVESGLPLCTSEPSRWNPSQGKSAARPRPVPEGVPLADCRADPVVPQRDELFAGELVREWSPEVNEPLGLPILAQKQGEIAAADDATGDVSLAAALAAAPPKRTTPAPFLRLSLPDPFEHRRTVRLQQEFPESGVPVTASPKPPQSR